MVTEASNPPRFSSDDLVKVLAVSHVLHDKGEIVDPGAFIEPALHAQIPPVAVGVKDHIGANPPYDAAHR